MKTKTIDETMLHYAEASDEIMGILKKYNIDVRDCIMLLALTQYRIIDLVEKGARKK